MLIIWILLENIHFLHVVWTKLYITHPKTTYCQFGNLYMTTYNVELTQWNMLQDIMESTLWLPPCHVSWRTCIYSSKNEQSQYVVVKFTWDEVEIWGRNEGDNCHHFGRQNVYLWISSLWVFYSLCTFHLVISCSQQ